MLVLQKILAKDFRLVDKENVMPNHNPRVRVESEEEGVLLLTVHSGDLMGCCQGARWTEPTRTPAHVMSGHPAELMAQLAELKVQGLLLRECFCTNGGQLWALLEDELGYSYLAYRGLRGGYREHSLGFRIPSERELGVFETHVWTTHPESAPNYLGLIGRCVVHELPKPKGWEPPPYADG